MSRHDPKVPTAAIPEPRARDAHAPTTAPTTPDPCRHFLSISATLRHPTIDAWRRIAQMAGLNLVCPRILDLIFVEHRLNVYGGQLHVRPPAAPTTRADLRGRDQTLAGVRSSVRLERNPARWGSDGFDTPATTRTELPPTGLVGSDPGSRSAVR